jgi:hypothetical protein
MEELKVVSFSNIDDEGKKNYILSLEKFGYDYKILGKGIKWKGFVPTKITHIYNYLKTIKNKNTVIIVTDVNDVIACTTPSETLKKFKSFNSRIVIGSWRVTLGSFSSVKEQRELYPLYVKNVYVNGGFYIGYVEDIINMYTYMISLNIADDQLCLGMYNVNHIDNPIHELDINSNIVYNINLIDKYDFKNNKLYIPESNTYPCFVHMIGRYSSNKICKVILGKEYHYISPYEVSMHNIFKIWVFYDEIKIYIWSIGAVIGTLGLIYFIS